MKRLLTTLACVVLLGTTVRAEDDDDETSVAPATGSLPYGTVLQVVIDASAGMSRKSTGEGERLLFDEAYEGAMEAFEARWPLPPGAETSLRFSGGLGSSSWQGGCETSTLVPRGVAPGPTLRKNLKRIRPSGPNGLANALDSAAHDTPRGAGIFRSFVFVTSGNDGCGRDVCATVTELRREVGLGTVRVLLFDDGSGAAEKPVPQAPTTEWESARARLSCLGQVEVVKTAADVKRVVSAALADAVEPATVTFEAVSGKQPTEARIEIRPHQDPAVIARGPSPLTVRLAGGLYDARAFTDGKGAREGWRRGMELAPASEVSLRVGLQAPTATASVQVRVNGDRIESGSVATWFVPGDPRPFATVVDGAPQQLPAGTWDLLAEAPAHALGSVRAFERSLKVQGEVDLPLDLKSVTGTLRVEVMQGDARTEDALLYLVPKGRRIPGDLAVRSGEDLQVPSMRYSVLARLPTAVGPIDAWLNDVAVYPDDTNEVTLTLPPVGTLQVNIEDRGNEPVAVGLVRPGERVPLGWLPVGKPTLVPVGKWDLRIEDGAPSPKVFWQRSVTVTVGDPRLLRVRPPK